MFDRIGGGASLLLQTSGTLVPGSPAIPSEAKLHVFVPWVLAHERDNVRIATARMIQYFAEQVAVPAMQRWGRAKGLQLAPAPANPTRRNDSASVLPPLTRPTLDMYARLPGELEALIAQLGNVPGPIVPTAGTTAPTSSQAGPSAPSTSQDASGAPPARSASSRAHPLPSSVGPFICVDSPAPPYHSLPLPPAQPTQTRKTPSTSAHAPRAEATETVLISPPGIKSVKLSWDEKTDSWTKAELAAWAESGLWQTTNKPVKRALPTVPSNRDDDELYKELVQMQAYITELEAIRLNNEAEIAELVEQLAVANAGESPSNQLMSSCLIHFVRTRGQCI